MDIPPPLIVVFSAIGALLLWTIAKRIIRWRARLIPMNDLERALASCIRSSEVLPIADQQLLSETVYALESDDAPNEPMRVTFTFPPEYANRSDGLHLTDDGKVQFGPWVICFSSMRVFNTVTADPCVGMILTKLGTVREFPMRAVFESARDDELDVMLNPFSCVSYRFDMSDVQKIMAANLESG
jgi:hypothetical protein